MRSVYRQYCFLFLAVLSGLLAVVAAFVAYFDPLWCTGFSHRANRITPVIDARQQKTGRLMHGHEVYDALVIGSSRVEQFRQEDFVPLRVFNYAAPSMYPDEYEGYIDQFLGRSDARARTVFLGLDFYGTNQRAVDHARDPSYYFNLCASPLYPLKTCLSGDAAKYAFRMLRGRRDTFSYDRVTLDKITKVADRTESDRLLQEQLAYYRATVYGDYVYNPDYRQILQRLKDRHVNLEFVVFTTPVTVELFRVLVAKGRLDDYERWLKDVVDVFGTVYNLMPPSSYNADRSNYLDAHHLYPDRAAQVVRLLTGTLPQGDRTMGELITPDNVDIYLRDHRQSWQVLSGHP